MNNDGDPEIFNSIEVKGMNRMSIPYIKRYFTNAGKVEEVKKLGSSVIIVIMLSFRNSNIIVQPSRLIAFKVKLLTRSLLKLEIFPLLLKNSFMISLLK